jgi:hypothetical protein
MKLPATIVLGGILYHLHFSFSRRLLQGLDHPSFRYKKPPLISGVFYSGE